MPRDRRKETVRYATVQDYFCNLFYLKIFLSMFSSTLRERLKVDCQECIRQFSKIVTLEIHPNRLKSLLIAYREKSPFLPLSSAHIPSLQHQYYT